MSLFHRFTNSLCMTMDVKHLNLNFKSICLSWMAVTECGGRKGVKWYWCWCWWWWCDDMRPTKIWEIMCRLLASLRLFSLMTLNSYEWEVSYECVGSSLWSLLYAHLHTMVGAVYRVPGVINILHYSHFNKALCMRYLWFESHTLFLFMNHFYCTLSK